MNLEGNALASPCHGQHNTSDINIIDRDVRVRLPSSFEVALYEPNDTESLLYVIRDGVEAEEKREQRHREGKLDPDDLVKPQAI